MSPKDPVQRSAPPLAKELGAALEDLGLDATEVALPQEGVSDERAVLITVAPGELPTEERLSSLCERAVSGLSPDGHLLLHLSGRRSLTELARWRDGLWPAFHVGARYEFAAGGDVTRVLLHDSTPLPAAPSKAGSVRVGELLCGRPTDHVRSPEQTALKFDANAAGWNGTPGRADYLHHRWMRRFVGRFAPKASFGRVLDFGCGAGWVGIEACLYHKSQSLRFFDPSPEMVRISTENAKAAGISDASGATGFGEEPPYPGAADEPFDLVLSSGVLSFARDREAWYEGLARTVAPGGTLILGDLNLRSMGMRRRRANRPILPIRELAAVTPAEARAAMEARGFKHHASSGYQLTDPVPQLIHLDTTRLGGALSHPLSWCNRLASAVDRSLGAPFAPLFDSWVMRFTRER